MFYVHEKCKISYFKFSKLMQQHNLRCGGQPNMDFIGNLLLFTAVKEFCKSIKN